MKKRFLIVLLLAFISSKETYNITDVSSQECDAKTGYGHFNVYFQPNLNITERSYFNLTLKLYQGTNELEVLCTIYISDESRVNYYNSDSAVDETTRRLNKKKRNKRRNLPDVISENDDDDTNKAVITCDYESPTDEGYYDIVSIKNSNEDFNIELKEGLSLYITHCTTYDEAEEIVNKSLSFRQVNSFQIDSEGNGKFNLYALATQPVDQSDNVILKSNLIINNDYMTKVRYNDIICKPNNSVEIPDSGVAPVYFLCQFTTDEINVTSIEIIGSDQLVGFPIENYLLDPVLTDGSIEDGYLSNMSDPQVFATVPPLIKIDSFDFENIHENNFKIIADVEGGNMSKIESYYFQLILPYDTDIEMNLLEINSTRVVFDCNATYENGINGNQLYSEQIIILSDQKEEVAILPGFKTLAYKESDYNDDDDDVISIEDAEKLTNLSLSFRQLKNFEYDSGTITFNFLALTTESLSKGDTIEMDVNLYPESGNIEEGTNTATCTLLEDANPSSGQSIQVKYECKIEELEQVYTSLRYSYSDNVAGVPIDDEVALNPVLTDQAIANKEIIDTEEVELPTFIIDTIDHSSCSNSGNIIINGKLSNNKTVATKFIIPLTYPTGISTTCSLDTDKLNCKLDRDLKDSMLIEQTVIKDGTKELFILQSINVQDVTCTNSILTEAEEKTDVDISFRQVSTIKESIDGLTFFFAAFVNNQLQANSVVNMKILILDETVEKDATCTLRETVSPSDGEPIQGDFDCEISLSDEERENMGDNLDLKVSPDNDDIGGCAALSEQERSPRLTDLAIMESEGKPEESLGKVLNFSIAENKEKIPPLFEVTSFNLTDCESTGKFIVIGKFSEDISEELTFNLPFSYPSVEIRCTVNNVTKEEEIETKCRVQKAFRKVTSFVLEPRLIKKKSVEKLYIKGNKDIQLNEDTEFKCENFNNIKYQKAMDRQYNAIYSFLQISRPISLYSTERRVLYTKAIYIVYIALRKVKSGQSSDNLDVNVKAKGTKKKLRILQSRATQDLGSFTLACELNQSVGDTCSFGCNPESGEDIGIPTLFELDDDENKIAGAPELIPVETNPTLDLTNLSNLQLVENLPSLNMTDVNSLNCSAIGKFLIEGALNDASNSLKDYNKSFEISFSNPDSSGICKVDSIESSNIRLSCDNTENFRPTSVMISPQLVKDSDGNPIFNIINNKTSAIPFGCVISDNATLFNQGNSTGEGDETDDIITSTAEVTSETTSTPKYYRSASSSGLSGGAIAGIILSCVAVLIIVAIVWVFLKKASLAAASSSAIPPNRDSSTLNSMQMTNLPKS